MRVGFVGLGKLGLPVALAWASKGHDVVGYDVSPHAAEILRTRKYPYLEPGAQRLLDGGVSIQVGHLSDVVASADLIFVAVQTPHSPEYEGITRVPETTADFDYEFLKGCISSVRDSAALTKKQHVTLVVISTVLPGTSVRELLPLLKDSNVSFVYAPMFIAQSTVVEDTFNPEFVLLGVDKADARAVEEVKSFFETMHPPDKLRFMSVASAEATKVAYNTLISQKLLAANAWMEICHKTGANVDDVMSTLAAATDRIVSPKYMRAGMSDGGGCHPRDAIALSHLAEKLELSFDLGGMLATAREKQTQWLAELAIEESGAGALPIVILGKAYKKNTNLSIGSPAMLLANLLREIPQLRVTHWDPYVDAPSFLVPLNFPYVFVIATAHDEFFNAKLRWIYTRGSVVIDPWGQMPDIEGVRVMRVGRW